MLEIEDLSVSLDAKKAWILKKLSLTVPKGEITAIIGPSGAGKSTLLKCLAGIGEITEGRILIEGEAFDLKKHQIGYMPQGYGLLPWQTVYQNCILPYKIRKCPFKEKEEAALEHIMGVLEISHLKKRYPAFLSGGQRQRVALARTLVSDSKLLLLDEPFSALDAVIKEEAEAAFLKLWQEKQCTTLFVTHSIEEALYLGQRILVMGMSPSGIIEEIENPWFGKKDGIMDEAYRQLLLTLKGKIQEGWQSEA